MIANNAVLNFGMCSIELQGLDEDGFITVTANCSTADSRASILGYADTSELNELRQCLSRMRDRIEGDCSFSVLDPQFTITLACNRLGQISVKVAMSQNRLVESHHYSYEIDQSYLAEVITTLTAYLQSN